MNKKYLKWLLKERKIALIFFLFLYIAVALVGSSYGDGFRWYSISERTMVFSMILAYVLYKNHYKLDEEEYDRICKELEAR